MTKKTKSDADRIRDEAEKYPDKQNTTYRRNSTSPGIRVSGGDQINLTWLAQTVKTRDTAGLPSSYTEGNFETITMDLRRARDWLAAARESMATGKPALMLIAPGTAADWTSIMFPANDRVFAVNHKTRSMMSTQLTGSEFVAELERAIQQLS